MKNDKFSDLKICYFCCLLCTFGVCT